MSVAVHDTKADQIAHKFFNKFALLLLNARATPPQQHQRIDKWFNLETPDSERFRDHLRLYRSLSSSGTNLPPFELQILLCVPELATNQVLVLSDSTTRTRIDPTPSLVLLESWLVLFRSGRPYDDAGQDVALSSVYKQSISVFRSMFTLLRVLPTWKLFRRLRRPDASNLSIQVRVADPSITFTSPTSNHAFPPVAHPLGTFTISTTYILSPLFHVDTLESLLDDEDFTPTLAARASLSRPTSLVDRFVLPARSVSRPNSHSPSSSEAVPLHIRRPSINAIHPFKSATLSSSHSSRHSPLSGSFSAATAAAAAGPSLPSRPTPSPRIPTPLVPVSSSRPPISSSPSMSSPRAPMHPSPSSAPLDITSQRSDSLGTHSSESPITSRPSPVNITSRPSPPTGKRYSSSFGHRYASSLGAGTDGNTNTGRADGGVGVGVERNEGKEGGAGRKEEGGDRAEVGAERRKRWEDRGDGDDDEDISAFVRAIDGRFPLGSARTSGSGGLGLGLGIGRERIAGLDQNEPDGSEGTVTREASDQTERGDVSDQTIEGETGTETGISQSRTYRTHVDTELKRMNDVFAASLEGFKSPRGGRRAPRGSRNQGTSDEASGLPPRIPASPRLSISPRLTSLRPDSPLHLDSQTRSESPLRSDYHSYSATPGARRPLEYTSSPRLHRDSLTAPQRDSLIAPHRDTMPTTGSLPYSSSTNPLLNPPPTGSLPDSRRGLPPESRRGLSELPVGTRYESSRLRRSSSTGTRYETSALQRIPPSGLERTSSAGHGMRYDTSSIRRTSRNTPITGTLPELESPSGSGVASGSGSGSGVASGSGSASGLGLPLDSSLRTHNRNGSGSDEIIGRLEFES